MMIPPKRIPPPRLVSIADGGTIPDTFNYTRFHTRHWICQIFCVTPATLARHDITCYNKLSITNFHTGPDPVSFLKDLAEKEKTVFAETI
jgi:hypothetical protein